METEKLILRALKQAMAYTRSRCTGEMTVNCKETRMSRGAARPCCPEHLGQELPGTICIICCRNAHGKGGPKEKKTHPVLHRDDNSDSRRRTYSFSCSKMKQGEKKTVLFKTRNKGWQAAQKCVGC